MWKLPGVPLEWFPWNDYVYTNVRLMPVGFSYTTALSQWEALQTKSGHTVNVLNFLSAELTFAPESTIARASTDSLVVLPADQTMSR